MISSILNNYIKGRMEEKTKILIAVFSESWYLSDLNFFTFLYIINYITSNYYFKYYFSLSIHV